MSDSLLLDIITFLANPVKKIVAVGAVADTFDILDPDDHLTWYRAFGRNDTVLSVEYKNQFESTTVVIDSVKWLAVPTSKDPHPPFDSLDHYKCYYIRNPQWLKRQALLQDQFDDPNFEQVDSLLPVYFCTPASKNNSPQFDTVTHYVAYWFAPPPRTVPPRTTRDQFGVHSLNFFGPWGIMVPTVKLRVDVPQEACCLPDGSCSLVPVGTCVPGGGTVVAACLGDGNANGVDDACETPIDTLRNHFKTWRIQPLLFDTSVTVKDQFKTDQLRLTLIEYLSNPTVKIVTNATNADTFDITRPNDHLNWYRAAGKVTYRKVPYVNQFESTSVIIDSVKYLLLPAQKLPHPAPDSLLGHYKCYRIRNGQAFDVRLQLNDQFDVLPESIATLMPRYFCTPAQKNDEPRFDPDTHYVAYEFLPQTTVSLNRTTIDQFGSHNVIALLSEMLLVPTEKIPCAGFPGDVNGDGSLTLADAIAKTNYIFNKPGCSPTPDCWLTNPECADSDGNGSVTLADVIREVNYLFIKPCAGPGVSPCCWKSVPSGHCCLAHPFCP